MRIFLKLNEKSKDCQYGIKTKQFDNVNQIYETKGFNDSREIHIEWDNHKCKVNAETLNQIIVEMER